MAETGLLYRRDSKANLIANPPITGEIVYAIDTQEYGAFDNSVLIWRRHKSDFTKEDADLLYQPKNPYIVIDNNYVHTDNNFTDAQLSKLYYIEPNATADQTKADIDALGIDADTLDGLDSTQFLRSDADLIFNNDVTIYGDLTVEGTTTTINSEVVLISDNIIVLNSDAVGTPTEDAGIEIERGDFNNVSLIWNETLDVWQLTDDGINYYDIVTSNTETDTIYYAGTALELNGSTFDHLTTDGYLHVPATLNVSNGKVLTAGPTAGSLSWETPIAYTAGSILTLDGSVFNHVLIDGTLHVTATGTSNSGKVLTAGGTAGSFDWVTPVVYSGGEAIDLNGTTFDHLTTDGYGHVTTTGTTSLGKVLTAGASANSYSWITPDAYIAGTSLELNGLTFDHLDTDGYLHVPPTSTTNLGKVLTAGATVGSISWVEPDAYIAGAALELSGLTFNHLNTDGYLHVPATSNTNDGKVLTAGSTSGSLSWTTPLIYNAGEAIDLNGTTFDHIVEDGYLHVPATLTTNEGKVLTAGAVAGSLSWTTPAYYTSAEPITLTGFEIGHLSTDGNLHVPATLTTNSGKVLTAGVTAGSLTWETPEAYLAGTALELNGLTFDHLTTDGFGHVSVTGTSSEGKVLTAGGMAGSYAWEIVDEYLAGTYITLDGLTFNHVVGDGFLHVPATLDSNLGKVLTAGATPGSLNWSTPVVYSAGDILSLDGTVFNHLTGDGYSHVLPSGTTNLGKVLTAGATENSYSWTTPVVYSADTLLELVGTTFKHLIGDGYGHVPATSTTNEGKVLTAGNSAGNYSWELNQTLIAGTLLSISGSTINHDSGDGELHVPVTGTDLHTGQVLTAGATPGVFTWEDTQQDAYLAGTALELNGLTFNHKDTDGFLHVTTTGTTSLGKVLTAGATAGTFNWETPIAYTNGSGLVLVGSEFAHADTSSQLSVDNSGVTIIQDITLDEFGHLTNIGSITLTAGNGLAISGNGYVHGDTSSQASVDNSSGTVIQDITLDEFGHLTGLTSIALVPGDIGAEPAFTHNSAFNQNFDSNGTSTDVSRSDHLHALNEISDVLSTMTPVDQDILTWEESTSEWVSKANVTVIIPVVTNFHTTLVETYDFTAEYIVGELEVYVGGIKSEDIDFTATDGSTVSFHIPLDQDTWVQIRSNQTPASIVVPLYINDLNDVYTAMSPAPGQVLTYHSLNGWQAETPDPDAVEITDLLDVTITGAIEGQVLTYDSSTLKWVNEYVTGSSEGIGHYIDTSISISSDDTALLNDNGTLNNNIGIGLSAGEYVTTSANGIFIGTGAGKGNGTDFVTGDYNTMIGYYAGTNVTSGTKNVLIGYRAGDTVTSESNQLHIANSNVESLIEGDFGLKTVNVNGVLSTNDIVLGAETTLDTTLVETTFTVNYNIGRIHMFREGVKMFPSQFTAVDGTAIVLTDACSENEWITVMHF